jgi:hypothetical protein
VSALVVDEQGHPVADGTPGELYLGGPSVARGYRHNAALTADRFVVIGGERLYRSGDVVVRDAGGVLHYFGRNDDQIKVRGIRVEPGEIEAAILHDPRVTQAAATWYLTNSGTRAVVAAIVLRKGASCGARELHDQLAARLPPAMIPARFLFVPWLPMTTSGKVDRKAIRAAAEAPDAPDAPGAPGAPAGRPLTWHRSGRRAHLAAHARGWRRGARRSLLFDRRRFAVGRADDARGRNTVRTGAARASRLRGADARGAGRAHRPGPRTARR